MTERFRICGKSLAFCRLGGWILVLPLFFTLVAAAQEAAPSTLAPDVLISRTCSVIRELTVLEAKTLADSVAFQESVADLKKNLEDLKKPLPERPIALKDLVIQDHDYIKDQLAKAGIFQKAWDRQRNNYRRAAETLQLLQSLTDDLQETNERLLERVSVVRPLMIEAKRRVDRRDLKAESFVLEDGDRSLGDWIARSAELSTQRRELLGRVNEMVANLDGERVAFEALPSEDEATTRMVRRIEIALAILAEATAQGDEEQSRLEKMLPEAVPTEVVRIRTEWEAGDKDLEPAAVAEKDCWKALTAALAERDGLIPPEREEGAGGGDLPEVQEARNDSDFAVRMMEYYEKRIALLEKVNAAVSALSTASKEASAKHKIFTQQSARLVAAIRHAEALVDAGALPDWSPPEGLSRLGVWDKWRTYQVAELDRLERLEKSSIEIMDAQGIDGERNRLEEEGENHRRAQARLETELTYLEFVATMEEQSDEALLALLAPDSAIDKEMAAVDEEILRIRTEIEERTESCLQALRNASTTENPYSQTVLRLRSEELTEVKESLKNLVEGQIPENDIDGLAPLKESPQVVFPEELHSTEEKSTADLAAVEAKYVEKEQQFAHLVLDFYMNIEASLDQLSQGLEQRRALDAELEEKIRARIQGEKQRYAAAHQIRERIREGRLDRDRAPGNLATWLTRDAIRQADEELRSVRAANSRFHRNADYASEHLAIIANGRKWAQIRSDAANSRAWLIGQPLALLSHALMPLDGLDEVERKNLEYEAKVAQSEEGIPFVGLLARFSTAEERNRFEDPLKAHYMELVNTHRVVSDLEKAKEAYTKISEICVKENEDLQPVMALTDDILAQRLFDYHVARYTAAMVLHPARRARIEEAFRNEYGQDLPQRLDFRVEDVAYAAELIFGARCRLIAERRMTQDLEIFLSTVGLQQEIGWYHSQIARVDSLCQVHKNREQDLLRRITDLRARFEKLLHANALRGFGIILIIPVIAYLIVRLLGYFTRRFEDRIVSRKSEDMTDRHRRLQTISKTTSATISVLVWTVAIFYIFARLGLDITPIVASASVVGLAVAFGAQALIKDFFYGFFILIENQFTIGDVVTLGTISGWVEKISLRITVLRDIEGVVHYIPNGSIGQVSNKTQGWSRVVMEISVAYKEDPEYATKVLSDVLMEMARDNELGPDILEDPVVAGVQNLTERSVDIRIMIKTNPGKQFDMARQARLRIKKRFDELGIEVPFPHRVVHHIYEDRKEGLPGEGKEGPPQDRDE